MQNAKIVLKLGGDCDGVSAFGAYANAEESPREPAEMAQADGNVMEETVVLGRCNRQHNRCYKTE